MEPGDNTTTEVDEDGFRFFQSACPAFSVTIMIEQIDLVGSCSLYASNQIQNPGEPWQRGEAKGEEESVGWCAWQREREGEKRASMAEGERVVRKGE